jgi:hypothetical protein
VSAMVALLRFMGDRRGNAGPSPAQLVLLAVLAVVLGASPCWAAEPVSAARSAAVESRAPMPVIQEEISGALQEVRSRAFGATLKQNLQKAQQAQTIPQDNLSKEPMSGEPSGKPLSAQRLSRSVQSLKADYETLLRNHERLQRNFQQLSQRHKELLDRNDNLQGSMAELMRYNKRLQADVDGLKVAGEKLRENHVNLQQVHSALRRSGSDTVVAPSWETRPAAYRQVEPAPAQIQPDPAGNGRTMRNAAKFPPDFTN